MNAIARTAASPYARRLARERGIALAGLAGSGPGGRVVASDIPVAAISVPQPEPETVVASQAPVVAATSPAAMPVRAIGAFAASIDLKVLAKLSADFGVELPLPAFLIKAASRAAGAAADLVSWRSAGATPTNIARAATLAPTEIARLIGEGASAPVAGQALVLSHITAAGVRPVSAALPADADLRIVFSAAEGAASGEALLIHDESVVDEAQAAKILAAFRDLIESPLRLLV